MSKEYQIEKAEAEDEFAHWAVENEKPVQLTFATAEVVRLAQEGLGELLRQVGRQFIEAVMEAEVEKLLGIEGQRKDGCLWAFRNDARLTGCETRLRREGFKLVNNAV